MTWRENRGEDLIVYEGSGLLFTGTSMIESRERRVACRYVNSVSGGGAENAYACVTMGKSQ